MLIKEVYLENFRNYGKQKIDLNENVNVFYGKNAQGKTNILEALYFCSFGRSFRTHKENELISFDNSSSKIIVKYYKNNRDNEIEIGLNKNEKKYSNPMVDGGDNSSFGFKGGQDCHCHRRNQ